MDTKSFLESQKRYVLRFDVTEDGDAVVVGGRYDQMLLSDVFVVDPAFVENLTRTGNPAIKLIAETILRDSIIMEDSIRLEVAKGEA